MKSKAQEILDRLKQHRNPAKDEFHDALISAIELMFRTLQQNTGDIEQLRVSSNTGPIGGTP